MNEEYFNAVKTLISEKAGVEEELIKGEAFFEEDLNVDEMELIEILTELEDIYHIELTEEIEDIETVQDLVDMVSERLD